MRPIACVTLATSLAALAGPVTAETPAKRGAYLVTAVAACGNCHSPLDQTGQEVPGQELSGRFVIKIPEFEAWAPNITPAAIGGWSDAELARAIREGIRPDGSVIGPPMPIELYRGISDADLAAIVAYLRTVPAVENTVPRSTYNIPLPPAWGPPVGSVPGVPEGVTAEYGAYLAGPVAHCTECHTPMVGPHLDLEHQMGAGGRAFPGPWGVSVSANITSAPEALARWTDAEVATMIRTGRRADGSPMMPPMGFPFYARMSDRDLAAIVTWLRTLPPRPSP